jgi:hypothetical protein
MIFLAVTNYVQSSPGSGSNFFLILVRWSKYTHKGPSDKSLFLHKAPSVNSTLPSHPLFHQDATGKYHFSNYNCNICLQLCVPLVHFNVSWFSEIQFGMIYLDTSGSTQPCAAFLTLVFCTCFFVFGRTHMAPNFLTLHEPVSVVFWVIFLVGSWIGLVFIVFWSFVETPSAMSVWIAGVIILNVEMRIIKLLTMVMSVRWKNSFFVHFQVHLLIE